LKQRELLIVGLFRYANHLKVEGLKVMSRENI
jgi:hypothetical protein